MSIISKGKITFLLYFPNTWRQDAGFRFQGTGVRVKEKRPGFESTRTLISYFLFLI